MSDYESIHGTRVKYLTSDPTLESSYEGQVWYNSTSGTNKALVHIKTWSSGGTMGTARYALGSATSGTQNAALGFGGAVDPSPAHMTATEEYSGFNWNSTGNLSTARRRLAGAGTQTSALAFGGGVTPGNTNSNATEEYGGSSWTAGGALGTARFSLAGAGTQTAGLAFGGGGGTSTEEYDGSSWTSGGALNTGRSNLGGMGTQTAALGMGGYSPGALSFTESYNGTSWTALNALDLGRYNAAAAGIQTLGIFYGGFGATALLNQTSEWDGTNWTTSSATMASPKSNIGGAGTFTAAVSFAGNPPGAGSTGTEEYNSNINAFTAAAWTSGGNMPKPKYNQAGAGTQTAALSSGGYNFTDNDGQPSIEYDGTSWGNSATLRSGSDNYAAGFGSQTAGVVAGGYSGGANAQTEEYNGSSWSTANNMSTARFQGGSGGSGILTAGLVSGGRIEPGNSNAAEEYDGTNWSSGGNLPVALHDGGTFGTQTASVYVGGTDNVSPNVSYSHTLLYDGSSWTSGNNFFRPNFNSDGGGTQTSAVMCGGRTSVPGAGPPPFTTSPVSGGMTAEWDGSNWVSTATLSTFRQSTTMAKNGTTSAGLVFGGNDGSAPGSRNQTEEYAGVTETITASTLTTS